MNLLGNKMEFNEDIIKNEVKKKLKEVFHYLEKEFEKNLFELIWSCYKKKITDVELIEKFKGLNIYKSVEEKESELSENKYKIILKEILGDSILDIGSGPGILADLIRKRTRKNLVLVDVVNFNKSPLPFLLYNGKRLPFNNKMFDTVLLIVVLHHCDDPLAVLKEAIRVSRKRIIIIESVYLNERGKEINKFFDWFTNRIILKREINLPFNYHSPKEWEETFKQNNLDIKLNKDLGWTQQPLSPKYRWFYVLDKKEE